MATLAASAFKTDRNRPVCDDFIIASEFSDSTSEAYDIEAPPVS
jgi:hypothetical protein